MPGWQNVQAVQINQGDKTCRNNILEHFRITETFQLIPNLFWFDQMFFQILILFAWKKHGHLVTALTTHLWWHTVQGKITVWKVQKDWKTWVTCRNDIKVMRFYQLFYFCSPLVTAWTFGNYTDIHLWEQLAFSSVKFPNENDKQYFSNYSFHKIICSSKVVS